MPIRRSPSTTSPVLVDGHAAVGVAVEREADVGAALGHDGGQLDGCGGAAIEVDVGAVGLVEADVDHGAGRGEDRRRDSAAGAVGAIDHHPSVDGELPARPIRWST